MKDTISISNELNRRAAWALAAPDEPIYPTGPTRTQYIGGFVRIPGMGSFALLSTGAEFEDLADVEKLFLAIENASGWSEIPQDTLRQIGAKDGCKYYTAELPAGYTAYESVTLLGNLTDDDLANVKIARGPHGLELRLPGHPYSTTTITAITDNDGLVTWFPGSLTPYTDISKVTVKIQPRS